MRSHAPLQPGRVAARRDPAGGDYVIVDQGPFSHACKRHPLTNVALRASNSTFVACASALLQGVPSPVREQKIDTGDLPRVREYLCRYRMGIGHGERGARKLIKFLQDEMGVKKIRFGDVRHQREASLARKHAATKLRTKAIRYAIDNDKPSIHALVHKGNIMKVHRRVASADWGYELALQEFGA